MSTGLLCFLIKRAGSPEVPGSMLGNGLYGGLVGGATGLVGGGLHGWLTAPDEIDEETGQPKSKWESIKNDALKGGAIGAGIGGLTGVATGWHAKPKALDWLKQINPQVHDKYVAGWTPTNYTDDLSKAQTAYPKVP